MEGETSWINHCFDDMARDIGEFDSFSELSDDGNKEGTAVSVDLILPDDLLERILAYLPIASIFRAGSVCKRWYEIVSSERFKWNFSLVLSQKPWYFMFMSSDETIGYAYDPILKKWYNIELPCIKNPSWFIASSCGLVCFMDNDSRSELFVCNPITKEFKKIDEAPGLKFSDYSALSISVNRTSRSYTISIVKSKQVPGNFFQWDLSIHIYDSETMMWVTSVTEVLTGWRGGDESVMCDGVLYFLIYSTGGGTPENRHGLITYNLSSRYSHGLLIKSFIPVPCPLTCGRLMNLKEKLVMVGGIGKQDRPDIIKGIGIWILNGKEWQEIGRMPHKFFQGFGEFDDVFASRGTDDLIYIQSYGAPTLLVFDMNQRQWKWSQKCPVTKRFPLQLFTVERRCSNTKRTVSGDSSHRGSVDSRTLNIKMFSNNSSLRGSVNSRSSYTSLKVPSNSSHQGSICSRSTSVMTTISRASSQRNGEMESAFGDILLMPDRPGFRHGMQFKRVLFEYQVMK